MNFFKEMEIPLTEDNDELIKKYMGNLVYDENNSHKKILLEKGTQSFDQRAIEAARKAFITTNGEEAGAAVKEKWDNNVVKTISDSKQGYEMLKSKSDLAYNPEYASGNDSPAWYVGKEKTDGKSQREEAQAKINEFNKLMDSYNESTTEPAKKMDYICDSK